nr:hypothetical protein [Tanacetum cinerariifolium]
MKLETRFLLGVLVVER